MEEKINIDQEALFFRYCNHMVSPEEKEQVEQLAIGSEKIREELETLKEAVDIQQKIKTMESLDINSGYLHVQHTIRKNIRRKRIVSIAYRAAAVLILPLLISSVIFGYMAFRKEANDVMYAKVVSAPGLVTSFELPDQSKVWLNANSELRYPVRFDGKIREVELKGEGYFEVKSDREHPFYVLTPSGLKVMACGTRFNVSTQHHTTETTLAEGMVVLLNHDHDILKEMLPGEEVLFDNETKELITEEVNLYEKLAWKDGKIIFRNAPLEKVFEQLAKRYNVDIVFHDEHNLSDKYSSRRVTFTNETIQQILSYLEIAAPLEWKISPTVQNSDSTLARQRIDVWLRKE